MNRKAFLKLAFITVPVLLLAGAIALWLLLQSQKELELAQQKRFEYFEAANQIRMLSGQLSARIRNYVSTADEGDLSLYYQVLAMTEGRHVRLNGRTISNEQMLRDMDLSREELNLLERARQATLTLARLEEEALWLMEAGRERQAQQKVFNRDYDQYSAVVTDSVNQFIGLLLDRLDRNIQHERQQNHITMMAMIVIFLSLVTCCLLLGWQLRQDMGHGRRVIPAARQRITS